MEIYNLTDKIEYLDEVVFLEYNEWANNPQENYDNRIQSKCEKIKELLNQNDFCKLILINKKELIGFISIFPHDCDELPNLSPWYATMYVKKEYRGKGYSKILNNAILKEARNRKYKELYLKTELKNYYEKFGAVFLQYINDKEKLYKFVLYSENDVIE